VFPDRTPSPGLVEYAKVIEPIRIEPTSGSVRITNRYDFADTGHLAFSWSALREGVRVDEGPLAVPVLAAGASVDVPLPVVSGDVVTVRAVLASATAWGFAGHEVAWGQAVLAVPVSAFPTARTDIRLGPGEFDSLGRFNPRDVQQNIASPNFGHFFNGVPRDFQTFIELGRW